jgi:hypothetical protein
LLIDILALTKRNILGSKVKVKVSIPERRAMRRCGGKVTHILTLALDGG